MTGIKINEGLFDGVEYFESPQRRRELVDFFQFEKRRVILGQSALDTLGEECRRLDAGRIVLVRDPGIAVLEAAAPHWDSELLARLPKRRRRQLLRVPL